MKIRLSILMPICLCLCACNEEFKPGTYTSNSDIKPGPGVFSGDDGEFSLYPADPFTVSEGKD